VDGHAVTRLIECIDAQASPNFGPHGAGPRGQGGLEGLDLDHQALAGRARQTIGPLAGVEGVVEELDAGEMAGRAAWLMHPMRARRSAVVRRARLRSRWRDHVVQPSAAIERVEAGSRQAAHPERQPLQGRVWVFGLLQHQHRQIGQTQLTGQEQADGASAGDYDVIDHGRVLQTHFAHR
jgi:hypothetical protein